MINFLSLGRKVPHPGHPQRQPGGQGPGPEVHHQVPDEEGSLLECRCRQRWHGRRGIGPEHSLGHELPGVPAQEALAERQESPHQVHHGTSPETLLKFNFSA